MTNIPQLSLLTAAQRASLDHLERLIEAQAPPQQFLTEFVASLRQASLAMAAVFWRFNEHGNLQIGFEHGWDAIKPLLATEFSLQHREMMKTALQSEQATLSALDLMHNGQVITLTCLLQPVRIGRETQGVLELFFRQQISPDAEAALKDYLDGALQLLTLFWDSLQHKHLRIDQLDFWARFEPLLLEMSRQKDTTSLGYFLVNELTTLLNVDRAFFAVLRGRSVELVAASGTSKLQKRSTLSLKLKRLLRAARQQERLFVHPDRQLPGTSEFARPLSDYLQTASSRMVAIQPIRLGKMTDQPQLPNRKKDRPARTLGFLVVENMHDDRFEKSRRDVLELTSLHTAGVLQHTRQLEEVPLLGLWRGVGRTLNWCYEKQFGKSIAVLLATVLVAVALTFLPWDYRVTATGKLMPTEQREVFAPWDAEVQSVLVDDGEAVRIGQPLVELRNKELEAEELRVRNLLAEKRTLVRTLRASREKIVSQPGEQNALELEGQLAEALVEIDHYQRQHEILLARLNDLTVRATIDGIVATFQLEQILRHRPVTRGEVLLEVMNPDGSWQLEAQFDDIRMGHVMARQNELKRPLDVSFILATEPTIAYDGQLRSIGTRAYADPAAQTNVVDVLIDFDKAQVPDLRIGAEVKAKVSCGEKSLGYVLFGDMIDYLRSTLWL